MYIVYSVFDVPEEKADEVIAIYKNRTGSVDKWPGFIDFKLLQNDRKVGELTVEICWDSKDSYLNWVTSDEYQKINELEKKYPDKELAGIVPKGHKYKVVAK